MTWANIGVRMSIYSLIKRINQLGALVDTMSSPTSIAGGSGASVAVDPVTGVVTITTATGNTLVFDAAGNLHVTLPASGVSGPSRLGIGGTGLGSIGISCEGNVGLNGANNSYIYMGVDDQVEISNGARGILFNAAGVLTFYGLPTTDPHVVDAPWIDTTADRALKVSAGA